MNGKKLICEGLLLIAAALCLGLWNLHESSRAEQNAREALNILEQCIREPEKTSVPQKEMVKSEKFPSEAPTPEFELPDYVLHPDMEMPEEEIDGNRYIGVLEIPALALKLPIISEWNYARLKIAPCRYLGSAYKGNLILAGHNYKSHFGNLYRLEAGDEVFFTDMAGNQFVYSVSGIEQLPSTAIEEMEAGNWDLTLFTCTVGGAARVTVRCELTGHIPA